MPGVEVTVSVSGVDALLNDFEGLTSELQSAINLAITANAEAILEDAQALCPVRTGALRDSIAIEYENDGDILTANIGTDMYYGPYVEFGTRYMEAEPFLFPAFEQNAPELGADIADALGWPS